MAHVGLRVRLNALTRPGPHVALSLRSTERTVFSFVRLQGQCCPLCVQTPISPHLSTNAVSPGQPTRLL